VSRASPDVAVLFGGPSPEHDVSVLTGLQAARALVHASSVGDVRALYWTKGGSWFEVPPTLEAVAFADAPPDDRRPVELVAASPGGFVTRAGRLGGRQKPLVIDVAIVCCHGGPGEDGSLQGALDCAGVAYTGPSAANAALGMDKLATAGVLGTAGIPVLPRLSFNESTPEPTFPGPYVVKPRYGGSSIGIEVVKDFATARALLSTNAHLWRGAVIEPYRDDLFDLQVAAKTYPQLSLSEIERPLVRDETAEILDYADKYAGGEGMASAPRELPAKIPDTLERDLRSIAADTAVLLGARGVSRIDFLTDGERAYVNEINTIPGSLARHLFINPPIAFSSLLVEMIEEAFERPAMTFSSAGADGSVLREAGNIAAKLA
jgi:D-alanine-D-alanine ligase